MLQKSLSNKVVTCKFNARDESSKTKIIIEINTLLFFFLDFRVLELKNKARVLGAALLAAAT